MYTEWCFIFFFFQAEDGIRDIGVTGVQTCALPIYFKSEGRATWAQYTADNIGSNVAFTLDGRVVSAPTIQNAINGQTTITGQFNQETATTLANQLRYGALPLTFTQATAQSISTELGAEQLKAGLIAGGIGIALVFLYALVYYRLLGLVMILSLVLSAVVVYAVLGLLGRQDRKSTTSELQSRPYLVCRLLL